MFDVLKMIEKNEDFNIEETFSNSNPLATMKLFIEYTITVCNYSYNTNGFKKLINYPPDFKFDLIIIDMTIGSCLYPLIQRFNYPPTIGITAFLLPPFLSDTFGNDIHPSYLPFYMLQYTEHMNFHQRVINYVMTRLDSFTKQTYQMQKLEKVARRIFGDNMDSMQSLERHISLLLCNINNALHYPQPLTPNIIPVGGLHIKAANNLSKVGVNTIQY
ncbi:hypothetical protein NQ314_010902 [Rhamnusium bicolor]|uniref:Uncharacterized protein n=1 Tax=Rhamnusium bicolor TaxID=1586634 RepID=A0AAV8XM20_9CUCU|nr:hypothetical protein NQ314_010902 [Rhamnusium bicolor]